MRLDFFVAISAGTVVDLSFKAGSRAVDGADCW